MHYLSLTLAAVLALGLAGCGKNDSGATTTDDIKKAADSAADATAKAAEKTADAVKEGAAKAVDAVKAGTTDTSAEGLIEKAKSLVAENKFAEASNILQQLANFKLTDEQTKLVNSLKEQIQKALASKAAGGVDNLLNK